MSVFHYLSEFFYWVSRTRFFKWAHDQAAGYPTVFGKPLYFLGIPELVGGFLFAWQLTPMLPGTGPGLLKGLILFLIGRVLFGSWVLRTFLESKNYAVRVISTVVFWAPFVYLVVGILLY